MVAMNKTTFLGCVAMMTACVSCTMEKTSESITKTPEMVMQTRSAVDNKLQQKVTAILENKMAEVGSPAGQVIVMEVATGQVKAMVNVGELEQPAREDYIEAFSVPTGLSRSIAALAVLESGRVTLEDRFDVGNGRLALAENDTLVDHNWHRGGYGVISLMRALNVSSIIGVYKAVKAAFDDEGQYYDRLRKIYDFEQNTLLNQLTFYNAVANNGTMLKPLPEEGAPVVLSPRIASREGIANMQHALQTNVLEGMGMRAHSDKVAVAGDVGTCNTVNGHWLAQFCGYFPAEAPQYTVMVNIQRNGIPVSGGSMAAPVFKEIAEYLVAE